MVLHASPQWRRRCCDSICIAKFNRMVSTYTETWDRVLICFCLVLELRRFRLSGKSSIRGQMLTLEGGLPGMNFRG
jgi:hypothetical protein